ncbi:hypothetical protein SUGI_1132210 [Cryptomeria japonica]|uniref:protein-tyrosine sulfotransferase isoform X3 n=1 Tax=Cryptomeria japonica TaxID=3369 RepID=UPI002414C447|nr:protein-tyrosine sulfotransferase isoform X3 [Cryptomeria japonica]GLJ53129.1 hypothetical protein SUGI_1132210 [Cryptomeria japonica]
MNSSTPKMMSMLLLLVILLGKNGLATSDYSYRNCEGIVKSWADKSLLELEGRTEQENLELKDLLFFLHVPRTGGRNYFNCFLRNLVPRDQECPRSYDKLRFDPSEPGCKLVVTHDDYSLMSMLPSEKTSVVTIMRNPVDRVLSTYEFSIEVASRFLIHPNLSSSIRTKRRNFTKMIGVSTLDIWPWKYLVPWMRKDLFARRDARHPGRMVMQGDVDSYDFPAMVMPLHEYIHQPIAYDIIHNGGTFQVAGLTNNSHLEEAQEIRQCVVEYPFLGKHVLKVAKRRLDQMFYVGLTENHKDSATIFANMLGTEMLSHLHFSNFSIWSSHAASNKTGLTKETSQAQFTVASLLDTYEKCAHSTRSSQGQRRISSLKALAPANFTKEERTRIPESTIKEIERLNSLDVELFKHAQNIFSQQRKALNEHKTFVLHESSSQEDNFNSRISSCQSLSSFWPFVLIAPIFAVVVFIAARGRSSKIKL